MLEIFFLNTLSAFDVSDRYGNLMLFYSLLTKLICTPAAFYQGTMFAF